MAQHNNTSLEMDVDKQAASQLRPPARCSSVSKGRFSSWSAGTPPGSLLRLHPGLLHLSSPLCTQHRRGLEERWGRGSVILVWVHSTGRTCSSSSVRFSPSSLATLLRFLKEIFPVSSSSNSRKAFRISSLESFSAWNHVRERVVRSCNPGSESHQASERKKH